MRTGREDGPMYKVVGCWSPPAPERLDAFEEMYVSHCEAACRLPGLKEYVLAKFETYSAVTPRTPAKYYRHAELVFETREAAIASLTSPEARRLYEDTRALEQRFGVVATVLGMGDAVIFYDDRQAAKVDRTPRPDSLGC